MYVYIYIYVLPIEKKIAVSVKNTIQNTYTQQPSINEGSNMV